MVFKILLIVIIGSTAVFGLPIEQKNVLAKNAGEIKEKSAFHESLQSGFGNLLGNFYDTIVESLKHVFNKLEQEMESQDFEKSISDLEEMMKLIFNDKKEIKGDVETVAIIQSSLNKIATGFRQICQQAIENLQEKYDKRIDVSAFKNSVDELKILVDEVYHHNYDHSSNKKY